MFLSHFMRVQFKIGILVVGLVVSSVPLVIAMEEVDKHTLSLFQPVMEVSDEDKENTPIKRQYVFETGVAGKQTRQRKARRIKREKKEENKVDAIASFIMEPSDEVLQPILGSFLNLNVKTEENENNVNKTTLNILELADEVLQPILVRAVFSDLKSLYSFLFVCRHIHNLVMDRHILTHLAIASTQYENESQKEFERKVFEKHPFPYIYLSRKITSLELEARNIEAERVFRRALECSPLGDTILYEFLAYRAGLFLQRNDYLFSPENAPNDLEKKLIIAAVSWRNKFEKNKNAIRINFHLRRYQVELYFIMSRFFPNQIGMGRLGEGFRGLRNNAISDVKNPNYPAYLLRFFADHGPDRVVLLDEASHRGDAIAQHKFGLYYKEKGNLDESINWFRKSADQGHLDAMFELGQLYLTGNGIPQDGEEVINWLAKAAEGGHARSLYELGILHAIGFNGGLPDMPQATYLCARAADAGMIESKVVLICEFGNSYPVPRELRIKCKPPQGTNPEAYAKKNFKRAPKQYNLGLRYAYGNGVAQNWVMAARLFAEASFLGHRKAQRELASCYEEGHGVPKIRRSSIRWIQQAATWEQRDIKF